MSSTSPSTPSPADYLARLDGESKHFSSFHEERLAQGIHEMFDLRRAQAMECRSPHFEDDPKISDMVLGRFRDRLLAQAATKRGGQALEIGCGAGWLTLELARLGLHARGVDISEGALEIARRFAHENPYHDGFGSARYELADLNRTDLPPESLDLVVAWNSLHHIPSVDGLMERVAKALKPDGLLLIYDHGERDWRTELGHYSLLMLMPPHVVGLTYGERVLRMIEKAAGKVARRPIRLFEPRMDVDWSQSPFEDAGQERWLEAIEAWFRIQRRETNLSFCGLPVARLKCRPRLRYPIVRGLLALDRFMVKTHLMQGEFIYLEAVKR